MKTQSFALNMARRCILAARKANHESVRLSWAARATQSPKLRAQFEEAAAVAREFALMNIGSAKNIKGSARSRGQWV